MQMPHLVLGSPDPAALGARGRCVRKCVGGGRLGGPGCANHWRVHAPAHPPPSDSPIVLMPCTKLVGSSPGAGMGPHRIWDHKANTNRRPASPEGAQTMLRWHKTKRRTTLRDSQKRLRTVTERCPAHRAQCASVRAQGYHSTHKQWTTRYLGRVRLQLGQVANEQGVEGHRHQVRVAHTGPDAVQPPAITPSQQSHHGKASRNGAPLASSRLQPCFLALLHVRALVGVPGRRERCTRQLLRVQAEGYLHTHTHTTTTADTRTAHRPKHTPPPPPQGVGAIDG
jgi:hypothetical protein